MSSPLVSIIIPCYNAASWVGEAVRSAVEQTYSNVEVVVVDDGSRDGSREVVRSVGQQPGADVTLVCQENAGVSAARNKGVYAASGEYFLYLDADDLLLPTAVGAHLDALRRNDADVSVADWINFDHETGEESSESAAPRFPDDPVASLLYKPAPTSTALIRSTDRPWDESMVVNEVFDYLFGAVLEHDMTIAYTGTAESKIRQHRSDSRITEMYDHWEPVARIELLADCKERLRATGARTPLRDAVLDQKQTHQLYAAALRYGTVEEAASAVDVSRQDFPSYYWFNPFGLAGFVYTFGPRWGASAFHRINRWLGRA